jgi:hypothetical protein
MRRLIPRKRKNSNPPPVINVVAPSNALFGAPIELSEPKIPVVVTAAVKYFEINGS